LENAEGTEREGTFFQLKVGTEQEGLALNRGPDRYQFETFTKMLSRSL